MIRELEYFLAKGPSLLLRLTDTVNSHARKGNFEDASQEEAGCANL